jgi:hypothetical protein
VAHPISGSIEIGRVPERRSWLSKEGGHEGKEFDSRYDSRPRLLGLRQRKERQNGPKIRFWRAIWWEHFVGTLGGVADVRRCRIVSVGTLLQGKNPRKNDSAVRFRPKPPLSSMSYVRFSRGNWAYCQRKCQHSFW